MPAAPKRPRRRRLAALAEIPDGAARGFAVPYRQGRRSIIVLRDGDTATGFVDACPHMGMTLPWTADDYLTPDGKYLRCVHHGALFERDGTCVFGPCRGQRLQPVRLTVADGAVWLRG